MIYEVFDYFHEVLYYIIVSVDSFFHGNNYVWGAAGAYGIMWFFLFGVLLGLFTFFFKTVFGGRSL